MYITLNSQFRPFTYDELTKPLQDYTEAYNAVEAQYSNLAQQTEAWKNIATQENSPEAYAMYKKYSDELNAVVDDFSRGMTIKNRGQLAGLKSRYASEITPIANAYTAMQKANAYRDTIKGQDASVIFNVDRYNSLDDFLNGQTADNNYISGKNLQDSIANQTLVESYSKYNQLIADGYSKRAAAKKVTQGDWIDEEAIMNNIYTSSGVTTEEAANRIRQYADTGILQGVGTFSANIEEYIVKEEIARVKNDNSDNTEDFNEEDAYLDIYNLFGGGYYEDYQKISTKEVSYPTDGESNYTETETTTNNERKFLTREQMLAKALSDDNVAVGVELQKQGLEKNEIKTLHNQFLRYKDKISDFRTFINYLNEYEYYKSMDGLEKLSFENYIKNKVANDK